MPVTVIETRTREELRQHYDVERELADRLRTASKDERRTLYAEVYDELFKRVPLHPQHTIQSLLSLCLERNHHSPTMPHIP